MGRYVKETCPNCKNLISGWHRDPGLLEFGCPLIKCSKCQTNLIVKNRAEYIMFNPWLYFRYFLWPVLGGLFFSFFLSMIVSGLICKDNNTVVIVTVVIAIVLFGLFILRVINNFKKEKKESLERTRDEKYLKELYQAELISKEKYKEMIDFYKKNN